MDMTHVKRIPPVVLTILLVLGGLAAVLAGVYMLAGLAVTLLAGGAAVMAAGLLVDF
jgi:hypothetical protein